MLSFKKFKEKFSKSNKKSNTYDFITDKEYSKILKLVQTQYTKGSEATLTSLGRLSDGTIKVETRGDEYIVDLKKNTIEMISDI